jgi:hypothetical protein
MVHGPASDVRCRPRASPTSEVRGPKSPRPRSGPRLRELGQWGSGQRVLSSAIRPRRLHAPFHQNTNSGCEILLRADGRPASATRWPIPGTPPTVPVRSFPPARGKVDRGGGRNSRLRRIGFGRETYALNHRAVPCAVRPCHNMGVSIPMSETPERAMRSSCFANDAEAFP